MYETPRIVPHESVHDDPASHVDGGTDHCCELDANVPANCFGHNLEDSTPAPFRHASVGSQCDGYCSHEDGYVDHGLSVDTMPTEK